MKTGRKWINETPHLCNTKQDLGQADMPYIHMINNWQKAVGTLSAQQDKIYYILYQIKFTLA